jgi:tetratricopeptide (TPR) repeat protein
MGHLAEKEKRADFYRQAVQSYTEAITRRVNYPEAYLARGHVHHAAGRPADAVADWEKALALGAARTDALLRKIADVKQKLGS